MQPTHLTRPPNFEQVLNNPGARLTLDRHGQFEVVLPRAPKLGVKAWLILRLGSAERKAEIREQSSRAARDLGEMAMRSRYAKPPRSDQYDWKPGQSEALLAPLQQQMNTQANQPVLDAVASYLKFRGVDTATRVNVVKRLSERTVSYPPELFSNHVAVALRSVDASDRLRLSRRPALREQLSRALTAMPQARTLAPGMHARVVEHTLRKAEAQVARDDADRLTRPKAAFARMTAAKSRELQVFKDQLEADDGLRALVREREHDPDLERSEKLVKDSKTGQMRASIIFSVRPALVLATATGAKAAGEDDPSRLTSLLTESLEQFGAAYPEGFKAPEPKAGGSIASTSIASASGDDDPAGPA